MKTRRKAASVLVALGLAMGGLLPAGAAFAASPQQLCEADGGTYFKDGSTATCQYPVGNSGRTKDTTQKGSFNSSHDEGYKNPGGNNPPGRQGGNTLGN